MCKAGSVCSVVLPPPPPLTCLWRYRAPREARAPSAPPPALPEQAPSSCRPSADEQNPGRPRLTLPRYSSSSSSSGGTSKTQRSRPKEKRQGKKNLTAHGGVSLLGCATPTYVDALTKKTVASPRLALLCLACQASLKVTYRTVPYRTAASLSPLPSSLQKRAHKRRNPPERDETNHRITSHNTSQPTTLGREKDKGLSRKQASRASVLPSFLPSMVNTTGQSKRGGRIRSSTTNNPESTIHNTARHGIHR